MYLLIDREAGEATLASLENITEMIHKGKSATYRAAAERGYVDAGGKTREIHILHGGYNFYDIESGELIAKNKHYSDKEEYDETGYDLKELRAMLYGPYGYDGMIAKMVLFSEREIDFPESLYETFQDINIIRRYRRGENNIWKEYYL